MRTPGSMVRIPWTLPAIGAAGSTPWSVPTAVRPLIE